SRVSKSSSTTRMLTSLSAFMTLVSMSRRRRPLGPSAPLSSSGARSRCSPTSRRRVPHDDPTERLSRLRPCRGRAAARHRRLRLLTAVERQGDRKGGSAPGFAVHLDRATVLPDDLLADRETQASPSTHVLGR